MRRPENCGHQVIERFSNPDVGVAMWACADCKLRFYPHGDVLRGLSDADRGRIEAAAAERAVAPLREALEIIAAPPTDAPHAIGVTARNIARVALAGAGPAPETGPDR